MLCLILLQSKTKVSEIPLNVLKKSECKGENTKIPCHSIPRSIPVFVIIINKKYNT